MIAKLILAIYMLFFPHCDLAVSTIRDFNACYASEGATAHCYENTANTDDLCHQRTGHCCPPQTAIRENPGLQSFVYKLPFVILSSCWSTP